MDKLRMNSLDAVEGNVAKIAALFPHCVAERLNKDGKPDLAIDFDKLRAELSADALDTGEERYQFTWPDKRAASRLANTSTDKTLRPDVDASVDFWNTKNLYIEGDNLDVLKVLRENYLGKVKMIYIDPPYNTGNDFVYNDDFAQGKDDFEAASGLFDEDGNQVLDPMQRNTESNGRFHTDWLNMIYPRLKVARDLLAEDGVIFISIDDVEVENLRKICDEIFGASNFVSNLIWKSKSGGANDSKYFAVDHEYILCYAKRIDSFSLNIDKEATVTTSYNRRDEKGEYALDRLDKQSIRYSEALDYVIIGPDGTEYRPKHKDPHHPNATWRWGKSTVEQNYNQLVFENGCVYTKNYKKEGAIARSLLLEDRFGRTRTGKTDCFALFDRDLFSNPKPFKLVRYLQIIASNPNDIILDFFSGSATTAHAVMKLNAEDGGHRKFIMVQLPEVTDEKSEARKAGYENICQIGEERIRRAGKKVKEEAGVQGQDLDIGFRVLKLDSSNMEDVFYTPEDFNEAHLFNTVDNVKIDRTPLDLLFQVMPELDIELSAKIEEKEVNGKKVFFVDDTYLIATFDTEVNESTVTEIAKMRPQYFVMRDASVANDNVLDNFEQIFKHYSPDTIRKIL